MPYFLIAKLKPPIGRRHHFGLCFTLPLQLQKVRMIVFDKCLRGETGAAYLIDMF